jgi:hypothetical protein
MDEKQKQKADTTFACAIVFVLMVVPLAALCVAILQNIG